MFRRIELISEMGVQEHRSGAAIDPQDRDLLRFWKSGLMGYGNESVMGAWAKLNNPRRDILKNCRFYFTEAGGRRYGPPAVAACQQTGQRYRLLSIKEKRSRLSIATSFRWRFARRKREKHPSIHSC